MKIICVVGARPNFPKIAPIMKQLNKVDDCQVKLVHTGQHYDYEMSQSFFEDLDIPCPDFFLNVGSGEHVDQIANTMLLFEKVIKRDIPDFILVVGDVNATLSCALVANKMGIKLVHVEAGLRSFDRDMPEEINRVLVDSISDYLFCTEQSAIDNLIDERAHGKTYLVGNVMIDTLVDNLHRLKNVDGEYGVVTLHRPSNVENKHRLTDILIELNNIASSHKLIWPVHPRTKKCIEKFSLHQYTNYIDMVDPMTYLNFMSHVNSSKFVITDSGGIQEETSYLNIPCLTIRENTERPITLSYGTNYLVQDMSRLQIMVNHIISGDRKHTINLGWDGNSAKKIVNILRSENA